MTGISFSVRDEWFGEALRNLSPVVREQYLNERWLLLYGDFIRGNCHVSTGVDSDDVIPGISIHHNSSCTCLCFFGLIDNAFMDFDEFIKLMA